MWWLRLSRPAATAATTAPRYSQSSRFFVSLSSSSSSLSSPFFGWPNNLVTPLSFPKEYKHPSITLGPPQLQQYGCSYSSTSGRSFKKNDEDDDEDDHDHDDGDDHDQEDKEKIKTRKRSSEPLWNVPLMVRLKEMGVSQVRLVMPRSKQEGLSSQVVPLVQAIRRSAQQGLDLMEVALQQDPPVIKALNAKLVEYQQRKKGQTGAEPDETTPHKEIRIKTSIADADFQRKVKNIRGWLSKGHACVVQVHAARRDADAPTHVVEMMQKVQNEVDAAPAVLSTPTTNQYMMSVLLKPK